MRSSMSTMVAVLLVLGTSGCGCNDDTNPLPLGSAGLAVPAALALGTRAPAIPVEPPPPDLLPMRIDVTFVLDDSDAMNEMTLGVIPANQADRRERSQAAQAIMRTIEADIRSRLEVQYAQVGLPVPSLDFAFAVVRYEDFGGTFTAPERSIGEVDDPTNRLNDRDARPFILNMPILRKNLPEFDARFEAALLREAPGDGNPIVVPPPPFAPNPVVIQDPQTGIEALWQVAASRNADGTWGGFDGDGDGSTLGSGAPTSLDPARNPQTRPGGSGDVPAIAFTPIGEDPDGEPLFAVAGEDGTAVEFPDPLDPAGPQVASTASGNIGGVGWRPEAARFVILSSDFATVSPTETFPLGTPESPGTLPPPGASETVTSTAGNDPPPDAPREAREVFLLAFDGGPVRLADAGGPVSPRRTGIADGPEHAGGGGVAPVGAHTVTDAIARLNELDIEVLLIGAPRPGALDTKSRKHTPETQPVPGETGVNGDIDSHIPASDFDPSDPSKVRPDLAPWFWFNAVTRLTMPEVTSIAPDGTTRTFPAVYNLATVWPFAATDPEGADESNVKQTVTDDLIERVRDWVDHGFGAGGSSPSPRPPLPTVTYAFTLTLPEGEEGADVVQVLPLEGGALQTTFTRAVQIPTYWSDETPPDPVTITFPLPAQAPLTYDSANEDVPLPAERTIAFEMQAQLQQIDQTAENAAQAAAIAAWIRARGDGFTVDGGGSPVPLGSESDPIVQAEGAYRVTVRDALFPGPGAQVMTVSRGCAVLEDLTANQDPTPQEAGTCPFPPPPPAPAGP